MTYRETTEFLYSLRMFGSKLGLENTVRLAALCGSPQEKLRFIHVAGTNGKGSTCAMLESMYRAAGYRTGLFTSPHLISFTERIQVNRAPISESEVVRWSAAMIGLLGGPDLERWAFRPTFFEFATVMAMLHFAEQRCGVVIWETGMGGRLDATNIVRPLASVITSIGLDHQQWLGSTLPEIAAEKAGIVKAGAPVVAAPNPPEVLEVIRRKAAEAGAPLTVAGRPSGGVEVPLLGEHQLTNAGVALETVRQLRPVLPVSEEVAARGLAATRWAGRLQRVKTSRGQVLLDGAHNLDGVAALERALRQLFPGGGLNMVLGFFQDKPWREMCRQLLPLARRAWFVPVQSERTIDPADALRYCAEHFPGVERSQCGSLREALETALASSGNGAVLVSGSLFFVGEALELLGQDGGLKPERELNEWDAGRARSG
jgi:dihydrofolate synthase/folylpolyglutamate synthase